MSESATEQPTPARRAKPRRTTVVGVLGEILITGGVLILLFLGWQLWFNDLVFGASQHATAEELSDQWDEDFTATPTPSATDDPDAAPADPGEPVVMATPAADATFANLIIPRLGDDYKRPIAEGVGAAVLNNAKLGMGHYVQTALPGAIGNFALASHRTAYGGAFHNLPDLVIGDSIYVETADGWYRYVFRNLEYVRASGVGVILPVPQQAGTAPAERLITLTTCNPLLSSAERVIAYGVYDSWYPRTSGPPAEIAGMALAATAANAAPANAAEDR